MPELTPNQIQLVVEKKNLCLETFLIGGEYMCCAHLIFCNILGVLTSSI
jgi:hypothetical protein